MKKIRTRFSKGFTLVEMIVVVAIIGVLAAILIPTMIGYVVKSRVTTANSTAAEMRKNIDYFLVEADFSGYGMYRNEDAYCEPTISISGGTWNISIAGNLSQVFRSNGAYQWTGSGSGRFNMSKNSVSADALLAISLANLFPEIQDGYVTFRIESGKCTVLYYTPDVTNAISTMPQFEEGGWSVDNYDWDYFNDGVTIDGYIVGTSPELRM